MSKICSLTNCPKSIRRATTTYNHPIDTSKFKRLNSTQFVIKKHKPEILKYVQESGRESTDRHGEALLKKIELRDRGNDGAGE